MKRLPRTLTDQVLGTIWQDTENSPASLLPELAYLCKASRSVSASMKPFRCRSSSFVMTCPRFGSLTIGETTVAESIAAVAGRARPRPGSTTLAAASLNGAMRVRRDGAPFRDRRAVACPRAQRSDTRAPAQNQALRERARHWRPLDIRQSGRRAAL
jgi:hypothetical protein